MVYDVFNQGKVVLRSNMPNRKPLKQVQRARHYSAQERRGLPPLMIKFEIDLQQSNDECSWFAKVKYLLDIRTTYRKNPKDRTSPNPNISTPHAPISLPNAARRVPIILYSLPLCQLMEEDGAECTANHSLRAGDLIDTEK